MAFPLLKSSLFCTGFTGFVLLLAVPPAVEMPGTQPNQVANLGNVTNCDNCHGGYDAAVEPARNWRGSMMAHAARDPIFWASVAIAEQDFPGAGDLCLRCHTPRGWLEGRSIATDGSMMTTADVDGTECAICHKMVNPDDSEHLGVQTPPYLANDGGSPATGYYGNGMFVIWPDKERMGPYNDSTARHPALQSKYHRSVDFCGTCHDVSNPVVGDLAHNNGAQVPLAPGTFSGSLTSPVSEKAAFNNFPYQYGIIERTYSEYKASALPTTLVADYTTLPDELQSGALQAAYESALVAGTGGNYEDGSPRYFSCQTCHLPAVTGKGANKNDVPLRKDLPLHDLTGGNYWTPDAIAYQDGLNQLRLGGGLSSMQLSALQEGKARAKRQLELAAALSVAEEKVKVVNLTGHKLISGYPEGRRMWLNIKWYDEFAQLLREDGEYGEITTQIGGQNVQVETILDLTATNTRIYEAKYGITQEWAQQLLNLQALPASLALSYDRLTGNETLTLGELAALAPGSAAANFHFVLLNTAIKDNRIPPFGFNYLEAEKRNTLPVPANQYGDPGSQGIYNYWDELVLSPPNNAASASVDLLYQPTSWEYIQFLYLANNKSVSFLANEGDKILDTWLNTGMASPKVMTSTAWCSLPGTAEDFVIHTEVNDGGDEGLCVKAAQAGDTLNLRVKSPKGTFAGARVGLFLQAHNTGAAPPALPLEGIHLGQTIFSLYYHMLGDGVELSIPVPAGVAGRTARFQALAFSPLAANGEYAASPAVDIALK